MNTGRSRGKLDLIRLLKRVVPVLNRPHADFRQRQSKPSNLTSPILNRLFNNLARPGQPIEFEVVSSLNVVTSVQVT